MMLFQIDLCMSMSMLETKHTKFVQISHDNKKGMLLVISDCC